MKRLAPGALVFLLFAHSLPAAAQHAWSIDWVAPGVTVQTGSPEGFLVTGPPWDIDGIDACPPIGAADARCDWRTHAGGDTAHYTNGVLAFTLDGSAAYQDAVAQSDVWWDVVSSGSRWNVDYDVHFVAENPADIQTLRFVARFKHNGATQLSLGIDGTTTTSHVQFHIAPQHHWSESPETGFMWTLELSAYRTATGGRAMVWADNFRVTEGTSTLFSETFPVSATSVAPPAAAAMRASLQVAPNPAHAATEVRFELPMEEKIAIEIFDVRGARVRVLGSGFFAGGAHQIAWDGLDASGRRAGPGLYFLRLETPSETLTAKTMLIE